MTKMISRTPGRRLGDGAVSRRIIMATRFPRALFVTIILMASSFVSLTLLAAETPPHMIVGFISDSNNYGVEGATVFVNDTTGTIQSVQIETDGLGRYSAGLTSYNVFDNITVEVHYHQYYATASAVGNAEPAQEVNIVLPFEGHYVNGRVSRPDGSAARHFSVNVTNAATGERNYCTTNNTGYYRIDLAMYLLGYSEGDGLEVSVDFTGYYGSNSSSVSSGYVQSVDIHLADVEPPEINIREAPDNVSVGTGFEIVAKVEDNFVVDSVFIHYRDVNGVENIEEMLPDGNFDGFNISIPAQMKPGTFLYHVNASDGSNTSRLPVKPDRFNITIFDNVTPIITHTAIGTLEAGVPRNVLAKASDNVAIDTVTLWFREVGGSVYSPIPMQPTGEEDELNATMPAQMQPGVLLYYITANDTSDNTARIPPVAGYLVNVLDTTAPAITHTPINSANVNDAINFTASVTDYVGVNAVWINYTDVNDVEHNETMTEWGINMWSYDDAGQNPTGILYYNIWANDSAENLRSRPATGSYGVQINDVGTPIITHTPIETAEVFEPINISAHITDDVGVTEVTLAYKNVSGSDFDFMAMALMSGDALDGTYAADIPSQGVLGIAEYYINATDGTNNISHPALFASHPVSIVDTNVPVLTDPLIPVLGYVGSAVQVSVYISDNHDVNDVLTYYRAVGNNTWLPLTMTSANADSRGNGTYTATIPAQPAPGDITLYFNANDMTDNNATLPAALPKLNPYTIPILDGQPPEIDYTAPVEIAVNKSLTVVVNVTDDQQVTEVFMHHNRTTSNVFTAVEMTKSGIHSYVGYVQAQMRGGLFQIYFTASDGETTNQSSTYQIPVLNSPPLISITNRSFAPIGELVDIVATVEDDVHVDNVEFFWRVRGETAYTSVDMTSPLFNLFETELGPFAESQVIEYHITAYDAENGTVWPAVGEDAMLPILDINPPTIAHEPIDTLTISQMPIISADVSDDVGVVSATVWFTNSTAGGYEDAAMSPVSGNQTQFVALLGKQPAGDFSYYIEASDGINTVRFPVEGLITVEVTAKSNYLGLITLGIVLILLIVAAALILIRRSKTIKRRDVTRQTGKKDA